MLRVTPQIGAECKDAGALTYHSPKTTRNEWNELSDNGLRQVSLRIPDKINDGTSGSQVVKQTLQKAKRERDGSEET